LPALPTREPGVLSAEKVSRAVPPIAVLSEMSSRAPGGSWIASGS